MGFRDQIIQRSSASKNFIAFIDFRDRIIQKSSASKNFIGSEDYLKGTGEEMWFSITDFMASIGDPKKKRKVAELGSAC